MTSRKWTPGPWEYEPAFDEYSDVEDRKFDITTTDGVPIADAWAGDLEDGVPEANASLIAAAPALYEALERAVKEFPNDDGWLLDARAALAHARGEF